MANTIKWMNEGEKRVLDILFGSTPPDGTLYLGLIKNLTEPGEDASLSELTEPSGFGYARKPLTRGQWTIADDIAVYEEQVFLAVGGDWGNITGYFIGTSLDNSGKLLSLVFFDVAKSVENGKGMKITPKIRVS